MTPSRHPHLPHPAVAAAVLCLLVAACGAALAWGSGGDHRARDVARYLAGESDPDGANDWTCRPSGRHPRPVVLVHGTFNNMRQNWNTLSPRLAAAGYCVFALNYGDTSHGVSPAKAVGPIATSAKELARFVERVRAATGADKVDLVAYSQGGLMSRWYLRFEGGARRVHALVALAPSNRGTKTRMAQTAKRVPGSMWAVRQACQACEEQLWSSKLVRTLNRGSMTLPGVEYTVISTVRDGVVQPYRSQQLPPGPGVTNVTLQDVCAHNRATHLSIPRDPLALREVEHALDPARLPAPADC